MKNASIVMSKPIRRTTISLPETLYELACKRMAKLHFATFSDYVQHLVRQQEIQADQQKHNEEEQNVRYEPRIHDVALNDDRDDLPKEKSASKNKKPSAKIVKSRPRRGETEIEVGEN